MGDYDSLMQAVEDARRDAQEAWKRTRECYARVTAAERALVDWLAENNRRTGGQEREGAGRDGE